TIQQLAAELGTNRTYLSDYVNSKYSLTFRNWIAQLRIDYSKRLLIGNSALSINTIAEMTGYSYNNFITVFTKMNRISPSQWRKEHS
ncbi:helix-turn-helix domain-containing protein, partial [Phocaeicola sartorii]